MSAYHGLYVSRDADRADFLCSNDVGGVRRRAPVLAIRLPLPAVYVLVAFDISRKNLLTTKPPHVCCSYPPGIQRRRAVHAARAAVRVPHRPAML